MLEYLAHAGYERTTQQLKNELRERREGKQQNWRPVGRDMQDKVKDRMLRALDRGEREEVLKLWDNFVPPLVRRSDKNAQKLEFYLNIFFAIFPLHPTNPTPQSNNLGAAMRTFKTYLETDGAALAVTPEFLAYYAMPHVPDISRHPSFKELFSAEWARALKARLADFLARTPQFAAEPRLLGICRSYRELSAGASAGAEHPVANASRDLQALKQRLIDSELRAIEAKREAAAAAAVEAEREAALKRGSKELCGIAAEAISTLGEVLHPSALASIDASTVNVLRQRLHGAEERLGLELSDLGPRDLGSHVAKVRRSGERAGGGAGAVGAGAAGGAGSPSPPSPGRGAPQDGLNSTVSMLAGLDYAKVKQTMIAGGEGAPALVQALRWRLTKPARHQRKAALMQYIQNDLLEGAVVGAILSPRAAPALREQAHRLINLFASEPSGRTYLLSQPGLIERLCALLTSEAVDTVARQNCLGALQKLSLRRQPQNAMIQSGVIAWLVTQLADTDALSQYAIEYGTALLMNLSLRSEGRSKCVSSELDILGVLSQLMESDSTQVRTYVNGTLYSILVRTELKARAAEVGLADSLQELIKHSDETFARQISYILEQIEKEPTAEAEDAAKEAADDAANGEEEEEEGAEEEEGEAEDEEVDVFAEAAVTYEPYGGVAGEPLLSLEFLLQDVYEAQEDASQLNATMERRAAAAAAAAQQKQQQQQQQQQRGQQGKQGQGQPARRRHHPDEPLQRPTTPGANADYGAQALQYAEQAGGTGAFGASVGPTVEEDLAEEGTFASPGGAEDETIPEMVSYPDPDAVDVTSPTIPVRNRLSRTPHKKSRDVNVPPVQPTASRPRATVERLHRRPTNNPPLDASPPKGGGSTSARNKPATKPDAADDK